MPIPGDLFRHVYHAPAEAPSLSFLLLGIEYSCKLEPWKDEVDEFYNCKILIADEGIKEYKMVSKKYLLKSFDIYRTIQGVCTKIWSGA